MTPHVKSGLLVQYRRAFLVLLTSKVKKVVIQWTSKMDPSLYKDLKTSRGFNYHYYRFVSDDNSKPTLLLLHGFPSLSQDWSHVVQHFQSQNYGIIVPDLLGYGGTDKPTDATIYRMKLMSRDVIEILDNENERTVIAIGHDWLLQFLSSFFYNLIQN